MISLYKASAGSGKTYQLTRQYLILLLGEKNTETGAMRLRPEKSRNNHRNILAITFTNKSTDEMKRRIIYELAVLARRERDGEKDSDYLGEFMKLFSCSEESLRGAASRALDDLLNDFSFFNVSTIDAFFQTILRTFAREAELTGNYELEMDNSYMVGVGVTQLLNDLSRQSAEDSRSSRAMARMVRYMKDQVSSGNTFNVFDKKGKIFSDILKLINAMLGEEYAEQSKALEMYLKEPHKLDDFVNALAEHKEELLHKARHAAEMLFTYDGDILARNVATPMNYVKDGKWNELSGWKITNTVSKCIADVTNAFKPGNYSAEGGERYNTAFNAAMELRGFMILYDKIVNNIYQLGMLGDVLANIEEYCRDNNLFMLSDTNGLLSSIIGDDEVPFIYERVGVWIDHYLIDEFQDTSRMQWRNLKPLVAQSAASGNDNLIIGDEKQCIYRWRNSDPSLINTQVEADFPDSARVVGNNITGNTNWRSSADVVRFNNTFFSVLSRSLGYDKIYENVAQQVAKKNLGVPGYVVFKSVREDKVEEYAPIALDNMMYHIRRQVAAGYRGKDLAVLVRNKKEGALVIKHLFEEFQKHPDLYCGMKVVSDDSLDVASAPSVRFILSMLRMMVSSDIGSRYTVSQRKIHSLLNRYEQLCSQHGGTSSAELLEEALLTSNDGQDDSIVINERLEKMRNQSLVSLVEMIASEYLDEDIRREENMFISAFEDIVVDYCERGESDVMGFLKWWDAAGCASTVSAPEDENAIRVLTVHKSKGLEFACVHVPFATWELYKTKGNVKWFMPKGLEAINAEIVPPLLPLTLATNMKFTPLAEQYEAFIDEMVMESLNVTYVAFTRAKRELIVSYNNKNVGKLIGETLKHMNSDETSERLWDEIKDEVPGSPSVFCTMKYNAEAEEYALGCPTHAQNRNEEAEMAAKQKSLTMLDPTGTEAMPAYTSVNRADIWAQIDVDRDNWLSAAVERGKMYHRVLQDVKRADDIPHAVRRLAGRGIIPRAEVEDVIDKLQQLVAADDVARWFKGFKRVVNERPMLFNGKNMRADRIVFYPDGSIEVIDYKTGDAHSGYAEQVRGYMRALQAAGYQNIRGYLWYLDSHRVEEV